VMSTTVDLIGLGRTLSGDRAPSSLIRFSIFVVDEKFTFLPEAMRLVSGDFDHGKGSFESMHVMKDLVHLF